MLNLLAARSRINHSQAVGSFVWKYEWAGDGDFTLTEDTRTFLFAVGGGGGGGNFGGGGGGGGGVVGQTRTLTPGIYAVTVGVGGAGQSSGSGNGGDGTSSTISNLEATGGKGGSFGSGGAKGGDSGAGLVGGVIVNPSFAGLDYNAGGGAGSAQDTPSGHIGGDGLFIDELGAYFGGGGGGDVDGATSYRGGLGGGGRGSRNGIITSGRNGLGGGGGGSWGTTAAINHGGGRGAVIVLSDKRIVGLTGQVYETRLSAADSHWSDVAALVPFESDFSDLRNTWSATGAVTIDTTTSVFGASGKFAAGAYIDSAVPISFGTDDFTIEGFVRWSGNTANLSFMFDQRPSGGSGLYPVIYFDTAGKPRFFVNNVDRISSAVAISSAAFNHLEVSRVAGVTRMFIDGVQVGASYTDGNNYVSSRMRVGSSGYDVNSGVNLGWLEQFRVTTGFGRHSANFTPPDAPFPNG